MNQHPFLESSNEDAVPAAAACPATRLCIVAFMACFTLFAAPPALYGAETLKPAPGETVVPRPDKGLSDLKGSRKEGRREASEEKIENLDSRLGPREKARKDAGTGADRSSQDLDLVIRASLEADALAGFAMKGPRHSTGTRVYLGRDLGISRWLAAPGIGFDLSFREKSGIFGSFSFLGGDGRAAVGPGGLEFNGIRFDDGSVVESLWEAEKASAGLYYLFSVSRDSMARIELGFDYLRSVLLIEDAAPGGGRAFESSDVFMLFLAGRVRFKLSEGLFFSPWLAVNWLSFGDEKYSQDNAGFKIRADLNIPLGGGFVLSLGYAFEYMRAEREDRSMVERSIHTVHGFTISLDLKLF